MLDPASLDLIELIRQHGFEVSLHYDKVVFRVTATDPDGETSTATGPDPYPMLVELAGRLGIDPET